MNNRDYLISKLGQETGERIYQAFLRHLDALNCSAACNSKQQAKVLNNLLLPRIALYLTLLEEGVDKQTALDLLEEHMIINNGLPMKAKYQKLDQLPCAFGLFKTGFTTIVKHSDLWDTTITKGKDQFSVTMHRCFWHDTFAKYGCPEMCQFACKCDEITYGDLKHIGFSRTQTLGMGGQCCDFVFYKK